VFHTLRHPRELGPLEIEAFLSHLANKQHVSAATQNQALAALLLLHVHVLSVPLARPGEFTRAKRPQRVPAVLTQTEVATVLDRRTGVPARMASLLYGAGLRRLECARMRAKDVDFYLPRGGHRAAISAVTTGPGLNGPRMASFAMRHCSGVSGSPTGAFR
jgi:site-specific recombinase XerD